MMFKLIDVYYTVKVHLKQMKLNKKVKSETMMRIALLILFFIIVYQEYRLRRLDKALLELANFVFYMHG